MNKIYYIVHRLDHTWIEDVCFNRSEAERRLKVYNRHRRRYKIVDSDGLYRFNPGELIPLIIICALVILALSLIFYVIK